MKKSLYNVYHKVKKKTNKTDNKNHLSEFYFENKIPIVQYAPPLFLPV